jgi:hypothetical protein
MGDDKAAAEHPMGLVKQLPESLLASIDVKSSRW